MPETRRTASRWETQKLQHLIGGPEGAAIAEPGSGRAGRPADTRLVGFLGSLGSRLSPPLPPPSLRGRLQYLAIM